MEGRLGTSVGSSGSFRTVKCAAPEQVRLWCIGISEPPLSFFGPSGENPARGTSATLCVLGIAGGTAQYEPPGLLQPCVSKPASPGATMRASKPPRTPWH